MIAKEAGLGSARLPPPDVMLLMPLLLRVDWMVDMLLDEPGRGGGICAGVEVEYAGRRPKNAETPGCCTKDTVL